jgi:hypothetical protein
LQEPLHTPSFEGSTILFFLGTEKNRRMIEKLASGEGGLAEEEKKKPEMN